MRNDTHQNSHVLVINQIYSPLSNQTVMQNVEPTTQKGRKGGPYTKTPLSLKMSLLKAVFQHGQPIKKVAQTLQIKYSTAKTLARQFKLSNQTYHWDVYQEETPLKNIKVSGLKRCHYADIQQLDLKNECKESQTDPINGNSASFQKFQIQHLHIQKVLPLRRIEIISRTVQDSLSIKPSSVCK